MRKMKKNQNISNFLEGTLKTRSLFLAVMSVILAGCSLSPLQDPKKLNAMIGKDAINLVQSYGVPSQSFQVGNHIFLAYDQTDTQYSPGTPAWGWGWGGGYGYGGGWGWAGGGIPPSTYTTSCQTNFEVVNGKVVAWRKRGDGC